MSNPKLVCMNCGKRIKLNSSNSVALCKKCQKENANKIYIKREEVI